MPDDSSQPIADGKVVSVHYTLSNAEGDVLDSSVGGEPLDYLHGAGNIVPGLERQMAGKKVGDSFQAVVPPDEGYGARQGPGPQAVPRSSLPDGVDIQPGMPFIAEGEDGKHFPIWVTKVEADQVFIDTNHPLAGETLHFEIEVTEVRDATGEEMEHGHVHGPGGHQH